MAGRGGALKAVEVDVVRALMAEFRCMRAELARACGEIEAARLLLLEAAPWCEPTTPLVELAKTAALVVSNRKLVRAAVARQIDEADGPAAPGEGEGDVDG